MTFFKDIIAQSYLLFTKNGDKEIAKFYSQEFNKVSEGSNSSICYSKKQFYTNLMSNIDSLIKVTYASKNKSNNTYEDSILRQEYIRRGSRQQEDNMDECYLYGYEYTPPINHNWEVCKDAEKLTYAIENKGLVLNNPITIIQPCESISPEPIVLRKKNLFILKALQKGNWEKY